MANASFENHEDITTFMEFKAGELIWKIVPPILIILGTVGNCLSILVLTRRCIRSSTTALFLTVLAFSDLFVLYTGLLRQWLIHLFEVDVRTISEFGCKLNIWMVYSSLDFSAWILIVVTLERVISAWLPHKAKSLCTKKYAVALLIAVIVFILLLNSHMLYGMVFRDTTTELDDLKCIEINADYRSFFNVIWPWIDLCVFCLIPFTVIVIGNALILFKVLKSQRKVKSRVVPSAQNGNRQATTSGHNNKQSSMTAMLFTLNVVFLLSTSPVSIYNIGYPYWSENASLHKHAQLDFWWAIVNMLMYVNNSLNFFLYCLSGTKFRQEVIVIFCSWRKGNEATIMNLATHSNYSRTRFDTPSATPSPRQSAIFTVNNLSNSNDQVKTNVEKLNSENQTGVTRLSNNSLHPNDALKIASDMTHQIENGVKNEDSSFT
ncbi:FMRFamide receptor-like [Ruditapes philippinarum]|uniref:FMRFamide receptor-like n=1 Tax=Ruditapes philippinarum TaxID=129788 RepID=UPI00295ABF22|nr:FMRFamide receptor-like [Ruditapes philippinarum]